MIVEEQKSVVQLLLTLFSIGTSGIKLDSLSSLITDGGKSVNQSVNQPLSQSFSQSVGQSVGQSISQSINQSISL